MSKPDFSIIIPIKNRTYFKVNYEPPGLSIFRDHEIEVSNLPKNKINRRGTDIILKLLINNLESLSNLTNKYDFEVIIVDFGSNDYNQNHLKEKFPKLKINIVNDASYFSRGRGLNIGYKKSTKNNIFFCDADLMFQTDEVFKNALKELKKENVFFPIVFDLIEPSHQIGYWRESGYGMMFATKKTLDELAFKWSEYETLGKEDEDAHEFFDSKNLVSRYRVKGYYHQWHPSSKFFKNSNYLSANVSPNSIKLMFNFDESKINDPLIKTYIEYLRKDNKFLVCSGLEYDVHCIINSKKLPQVAAKKQIEEYEKKYVRKIKTGTLERFHVLPKGFNYFNLKQPQNPKWLNNVLDWMLRIERNNFTWTLQGGETLQLSAISLYSKLVKIFENYIDNDNDSIIQIDKNSIRNKIISFLDQEDNMFKQNKDNDRIISESRQSYSALINLGYNIIENKKYDVKLDNYFPKPLYFMEEKYWENPWKAGAHLSHYIFFCHMKGDKGEIEEVFNNLQKYAKKDGWYHGNPSEEQLVNGIMKVFTAYDVIGKEIDTNVLKNITDRMLKVENYEGGCGVYDYAYVLVKCLKANHKVEEIRKRLFALYDKILEYQMPDGGFKYSKDLKKKDTYSGKEITPPGPLGCIHATTVFCMALTMLNNALDLGIGISLAYS